MILNPEDFITLGKTMIEDDSYGLEARRRTAIGRIYYGLLHYIRIIKHLTYIDTEHLHTDLIDKITDLDTKLGNFLVTMKEFRTKADYNLNKKPNLDSFLKVYKRIKKRLEVIDVA